MDRFYDIKNVGNDPYDLADYSEDEENEDEENEDEENDDNNYRYIKIDQFKINIDEYDDFLKIKSSIPDFADSVISSDIKTLFAETLKQIIEEVNDLEYFFESLGILNSILVGRGISLEWKIYFFNEVVIGNFAKGNSSAFSLNYNLFQR